MIYTLYDLMVSIFNNVINALKKLSNAPNIIQGIVIALLTVKNKDLTPVTPN